MIENIFTYLSTALSENFSIAILASFSWGILSILLSPCHLSSIPLIIGYINKQGNITLRRTFSISLIFALGMLVTIALIGVITASLGRLMGDIGAYGNYVIAVVFLVIGLYLLGIIELPWEGSGIKATNKKGLIAAFVIGLLFGIGLGPCTFAYMAPVLGAAFQVARTYMFYAVLLLLAFGVGQCMVIITAGTLTKKIQEYLNWSENSKTVSYIRKICGVLVILGGAYLIYNAS
jgi:cytochrome c-type biogenesis protein